MEHDFYTNIRAIDVCTEFDMFEVKVPIIFFGTPGFSARRDGRYLSRYYSYIRFIRFRVVLINSICCGCLILFQSDRVGKSALLDNIRHSMINHVIL